MVDINVNAKGSQVNNVLWRNIVQVLAFCIFFSIIMIPINYLLSLYYPIEGSNYILILRQIIFFLMYLYIVVLLKHINIFEKFSLFKSLITIFLIIKVLDFIKDLLYTMPSVYEFIKPFCIIPNDITYLTYLKCGGSNTLWWFVYHLYNWLPVLLIIELIRYLFKKYKFS